MPNYRELTIKEILYDFAVIRGDIKEPYAREALAGIIEDKITKAVEQQIKEARAEALREAATDFAEGEWVDAFMAGDVEDDVSAVRATERWFLSRAAEIAERAS